MIEAKPSKPTLAEKRIAFVREYLAQLEALIEREAEAHSWASSKSKALVDYLAVNRPELFRATAEVGYRLTTSEDRRALGKDLKVLIREWERANQTAIERIDTLKAFLNQARALEKLELTFDRAKEIAEGGVALGNVHRVLLEGAPKIEALRDELGIDQHEVQRFLADVGRSIDDFPLARGARHVIHYVATEINAAVGAYREWPTTRHRPSTLPRPSAPPLSPLISITNNPSATATSSAIVNVANVLEQLTKAIEQAAPDEKKSKWREVVNDIVGTAAGAGVKAALEKLLGSGS